MTFCRFFMPSILRIRKRPSYEKDSEDPDLSESTIKNRACCIVWYLSSLKGTGLSLGCDIGLTEAYWHLLSATLWHLLTPRCPLFMYCSFHVSSLLLWFQFASIPKAISIKFASSTDKWVSTSLLGGKKILRCLHRPIPNPPRTPHPIKPHHGPLVAIRYQ